MSCVCPSANHLTTLASSSNPPARPVRRPPPRPPRQVFTEAELKAIAELCIQHDVIAICDEVYEHLVLNGTKHISLRSLPGMRERSIRLGSAGKTFSFTAWKVRACACVCACVCVWGGGAERVPKRPPPPQQLRPESAASRSALAWEYNRTMQIERLLGLFLHR